MLGIHKHLNMKKDHSLQSIKKMFQYFSQVLPLVLPIVLGTI